MDQRANPESDFTRTLGIDQSSIRGKSRKRLIIVALTILVMVIAVAIWWRAGNKSSTQYKTQKAQRGNLIITVTATGNLEPTNQVDVGTEVSGTIESVEGDYNDRVKVGQILARLETSKLKAQVLKSKAALASSQAKVLQAQATVREARRKLERLQLAHELSSGKIPSRQYLDAAEGTLMRARADEAGAMAHVSEAQASLDVNQTDLTKAVIYSPIDGFILKRTVEPGQTVVASFQTPVLFSLAENLTRMELHVFVDEADVGRVRDGQEATFTVDAYPNRKFPALVTKVRYGSQTIGGVVTYETLLKANNPDLVLRPGMTATADITVKKVENAILVPNTALNFVPPTGEPSTEKQHRVWILLKGHPIAITVITGSTNGIVTEIISGGIEPGTELLVDTINKSDK